MARRRPLDEPYLIFAAPGYEWRVLKSYQRDNSRLGARWRVAGFGPMTDPDFEFADEVVVRVLGRGALVYQDPTLPGDLLAFSPAPDPLNLALAGVHPDQVAANTRRGRGAGISARVNAPRSPSSEAKERRRHAARTEPDEPAVSAEEANAYLRRLVEDDPTR
jgi:hypothetical protein